jgi:hypothetical protein
MIFILIEHFIKYISTRNRSVMLIWFVYMYIFWHVNKFWMLVFHKHRHIHVQLQWWWSSIMFNLVLIKYTNMYFVTIFLLVFTSIYIYYVFFYSAWLHSLGHEARLIVLFFFIINVIDGKKNDCLFVNAYWCAIG